jgi:hypothetical protein
VSGLEGWKGEGSAVCSKRELSTYEGVAVEVGDGGGEGLFLFLGERVGMVDFVDGHLGGWIAGC